jgi:hypothetical protein
LPPLVTGVIGQVWNPKATYMHTEVQHMTTAASARTEVELASELDVPGAKGKRTSKSTRNAGATAKGKEVTVK